MQPLDEKFAHIGELEKLLPHWNEINIPVTGIAGQQ
jgi:hypothetical protein